MSTSKTGLPTIIVPYPGPSDKEGIQDIFVYLRPETNGVMAESTILKVIKEANGQEKSLDLVFLANYPGEFIVRKQLVEQYYALKFHFAVSGKKAFTQRMRSRFESWFGANLDDAPVMGAFEALGFLGLDPEELFRTWVPEQDVCIINGQCIKKISNIFVINYDIPALIHKNSRNTDIAVMMFRTGVAYDEFKDLVVRMHKALCGAGILDPQYDTARAFHYSKSPFEQLMDGLTYLGSDDRLGISLKDLTFMRYLDSHGVSCKEVEKILLNPIVQLRKADGKLEEEHFFQSTQFNSFGQALDKFRNIESILELIHHNRIIHARPD